VIFNDACITSIVVKMDAVEYDRNSLESVTGNEYISEWYPVNLQSAADYILGSVGDDVRSEWPKLGLGRLNRRQFDAKQVVDVG
jgi:hypothetical protein